MEHSTAELCAHACLCSWPSIHKCTSYNCFVRGWERGLHSTISMWWPFFHNFLNVVDGECWLGCWSLAMANNIWRISVWVGCVQVTTAITHTYMEHAPWSKTPCMIVKIVVCDITCAVLWLIQLIALALFIKLCYTAALPGIMSESMRSLTMLTRPCSDLLHEMESIISLTA